MGTDPPLRFVTGSLHVDFLRPTPLGPELEVRGKILEVKEKKVVVEEKLIAEGQVCAVGKVVAVLMPETMLRQMTGGRPPKEAG
jgi:acyl-CoA thioesterase FadM